VRILLDNCVPADLAPHIRGHAVETAAALGWTDLDDGPLLNAMTGQFDVLLTVDASLTFQQSIAGRPVSLVILRARSNRVGELARLIPELHRVLKIIASGDVRYVPAN
jgi:predicted nuclease of predicted toxin-antitoxin system